MMGGRRDPTARLGAQAGKAQAVGLAGGAGAPGSPVTQASMEAWASRPMVDSTAAAVSALLLPGSSLSQSLGGRAQQRAAWQQMAAAAHSADRAPAAMTTESTQGARDRLRLALSSRHTPTAVPAAANCEGRRWAVGGQGERTGVRRGAEGRCGGTVDARRAAGQAGGARAHRHNAAESCHDAECEGPHCCGPGDAL